MNENENQIVVYQPDETIRLDVRLGNETVWLSQQQMAELFQKDRTVIGISERLENLIEELHNSKSNFIIGLLNMIPFIIPDAHTRPFKNPRYNKWAGIILPVGILLWLRVWRYRLRLSRDLDKLQEVGQEIIKRINAIEKAA